jgi:tRNA pseudouridine13 synthase
MPDRDDQVDCPCAFGAQLGTGVIRQHAADFRVVELPAFTPSGAGEHVVLRIRKENANTDWVARGLARFAGVSRRAVSYAGRKDRHAIAEQWFSVHLPGRKQPDWRQLRLEGVEVLEAHRHSRKVRKGALRGNGFRILVRALTAERELLDVRLRALATRGFPNYFGAQRFGIDRRNLDEARNWFAESRRRKPPNADMLLSAARAALFNAVLARRVNSGSWCEPLPGDRLSLDGSSSSFLCQVVDDDIRRRAHALDLHPTGPLWGNGEPPVSADVLALERQIAAGLAPLATGLEKQGLAQERRALRTRAVDLVWSWPKSEQLELQFVLGRGSFATALLDQVLQPVDSALSARGQAFEQQINGPSTAV